MPTRTLAAAKVPADACWIDEIAPFVDAQKAAETRSALAMRAQEPYSTVAAGLGLLAKPGRRAPAEADIKRAVGEMLKRRHK